MNKGLLKIALLSMVCASMPAAITSCKDYDDDINALGQQDKDLAAQITAINAKIAELESTAKQALDNANKALQDAAAAKDAAEKAAAEAKAAKEFATAAANQAKADALKEINEKLAGYTKVEETAALQARVKALEEALAKLTPGGSETPSYDEAIQGLQTQLDALNKYKDLLANLAGKEELLNGLQLTITEITAAIAGLQNQTSGFDTTLETISARVAALEGNLVTINGDELRALVFNPVFYYHGIEAMWAKTWGYVNLGVEEVNADGEFATDAPVAGDSVFMTPDLVAEYHMNPSTAVMPKDVKAYSFTNTIKHKDFVRAAGVPVPTITAAEVEGGNVTVTANLKDGILPYIAKDSKVTVLALQVSLGDTVITSDYAALKPLYNYGFALANATEKEHQTHLYTTMADAIKNDPQFEVAWNSKGVNIAEWVNTHYNTDKSRAAGKDLMWDVNATKETVRLDGFDYSYELVGYHLGENTTSESAHAALEVKGNDCVLRPQMTKDGKQQAFGAEQGMSTIDRLPIVRVVLKDTVSGKNAAVGYIKVQIVPDTKEDEYTVIDPFTFKTGYTAQCSLQEFKDELTWWQVEEKIIEKLGISKMEFEEQYVPDYVSGSNNGKELFPGAVATSPVYVLKQFDKAGEGAKELARTEWIGVAGKTEYDEPAAETEVIKWNIGGEQAYKLFVDQKKTSTSVTVRFVKTYTVSMGSNHTQTVHHYVYVTLTWAPNPLNVTPAGEIKDDLKIPEMWYKAWSPEVGLDETHLNVNVPRNESTNPNECEYVSHLLYPWVNEMITFSNINAIYKGYEDAKLDKYLTFDQKLIQNRAKGVSGAEYVLSVSADGLTLQATLGTVTQLVAVISNNEFKTNMVTTDSKPVITYQETAFAKDILSAYSHTQLAEGETLAAKLVISAWNQCDKPIALTNNTYNVRFLRPVNMNIIKDAEMVDAHNDGSTIDLADYMNFTDWRSDDPMSFFSTHRYYYWYYGLESIKIGYVDKTNPGNLNAVASGKVNHVVTTSLGNGTLGTTVLSSVAPNMDLVYTPATNHIDNYNFGKLTYYNRRETTNKPFDILVPIVLTYKWGYLTGNLKITVNPTIGNSEL